MLSASAYLNFRILSNYIIISSYGACFYPDTSVGNYLLAARPGKRIWLADSTTGDVKQTLNFKDSLSSYPSPILPLDNNKNNSNSNNSNEEIDQQSILFSKLLPITNSLVFAYSNNAIFLIDLKSVKVVEWHIDITDIEDAYIFENCVYLLHGINPPNSNNTNNSSLPKTKTDVTKLTITVPAELTLTRQRQIELNIFTPPHTSNSNNNTSGDIHNNEKKEKGN